MLKRSIGLFIIFSPFTSYFALSPWLRFPVVLLMFVCIFFIIKLIARKKLPSKLFFIINNADLILLLLLSTIVFSLLINQGGTKGFNHTLAYSFAFFLYYIALKKILDFEQINYLFILRMFAITSSICGIIIISDWILINFFNTGFREYFVNLDHKTANMLYYKKGYFIAVGGVAEEPGSMALFMNIISPLGLLYWKIIEKNRNFVLLFIIYLISMIFLASIAGLICILSAFFIILILNKSSNNIKLKVKKKKLIIYLFISIFTLTSTFLFIRYNHSATKLYTEITSKIMLNEEGRSSQKRSFIWKEALINWKENPFFGNGPGSSITRYNTNYHSVYLTLLADTGIISLILFLYFLLSHFRKLLRITSKYRSYLIIPFLSVLIHFAVVGDFYHAPFWILLIVIQMIYKSKISIN